MPSYRLPQVDDRYALSKGMLVVGPFLTVVFVVVVAVMGGPWLEPLIGGAIATVLVAGMWAALDWLADDGDA